MNTTYKLTNTQLNKAIAGRRFADTAVEVARMLMVEGKNAIEVAEAFSITRGRVYQIRDQVWGAHMQTSTYPPTWKTVTLTLSPALLQEVTERAEREREAWLAAKAQVAEEKSTAVKRGRKGS